MVLELLVPEWQSVVPVRKKTKMKIGLDKIISVGGFMDKIADALLNGPFSYGATATGHPDPEMQDIEPIPVKAQPGGIVGTKEALRIARNPHIIYKKETGRVMNKNIRHQM